MALNFPNSPNINDVYVGDNGVSYTYDGTKWVGLGSANSGAVTLSTSRLVNGDYTVQLNSDGVLTIPVDGDITRDGVSVLGSGNPDPATRWDVVPAQEGCPIFTELTPDYFKAYTQNSHIDLRNDSYWTIGSNATGSGLFGLDGDSTLYSNGGNVVVRTNDSQSEFVFGADGNLTIPNGINYANGQSILSGISGGNATTGDLSFVDNAMYNLNGVIVENADLSHGATSAVIIPTNGATDPLQLNNYYGPVNITSGDNNVTKTWTFGPDGQLVSPQGGRIGDTYSDSKGVGLSAGPGEDDYAVINSHSGGQYVETNETAVYIGTNYPDTNAVWTFDKTGNVIFPNGSTQTTAWLGNVDAVAAHINFSASAVGHNPGNGTITFSDGTRQNTAYIPSYVQNNINLDGGGSSTVYEVETAFADGGFASIRSFSETFDGSEGNNYILDGGRA